jgi:hypothetical protein
MIFEKNAQTGELAFSKSLLFLMTLKELCMMSSEVFFNGKVAFLLPFLIDLLIVYPTDKKISIYITNFLKKPNFFYNTYNNFFKVIEKTKQTLSAESFFKTLIDLSLDFFQKLCVWVFDFLDTLYIFLPLPLNFNQNLASKKLFTYFSTTFEQHFISSRFYDHQESESFKLNTARSHTTPIFLSIPITHFLYLLALPPHSIWKSFLKYFTPSRRTTCRSGLNGLNNGLKYFNNCFNYSIADLARDSASLAIIISIRSGRKRTSLLTGSYSAIFCASRLKLLRIAVIAMTTGNDS